MLFDSKSFGVMRAGLNGLAVQQQTILHNLANLETPGYKAKIATFKARVYTDDATSIRPDGNNVDADSQSMQLYQNYVQQLYLYQKISGQFTNLRYVLNQSAK